MNLEAVEVPHAEARKSYAAYMRAARDEKDAALRREMEEIAAAYKRLAREGASLIALTPTVARGGTTVYERGERLYALPRLAVCRADAKFVFTLGVRSDGGLQFTDRLRFASNYRAGILDLDLGLVEPAATVRHGGFINGWTREAWAAQVPIVPPQHRPRASLRNFHILWEVDHWAWRIDPAPSRDPVLLRHIGGDVYAVEAHWDLTEVERLVLSGRKLEL